MARGLDSASGVVEIAPVGWTRRRARRRNAPEGQSALSSRIRCPIREWQAACAHCSGVIIMLLRSDVIVVLLATVLCCRGVG
jgi:hypothetical protein